MITALVGAILMGAPADITVTRAQGQYELAFPGGEPFARTKTPVQGLSALSFENSQTKVALWREGGTSRYAVSLDGRTAAATRVAQHTIEFGYAIFDPLVSTPAVPQNLAAGSENELYVVQFLTTPLEEYRRQIKALGGTIYSYQPQQAYIVRMNDAARAQVSQLPFVRWVGPYQPAYRLEKFLLDGLRDGSLGTLRYTMVLFESGSTQKIPVGNRIRALKGVVNDDDPHGYLLEATLTPEQLLAAASWNEVQWIDRWGAPEEDLNIARQYSGTDYLESVGGYTGAGVRGQVRDGGVRATHVAFQNPPLIVRSNTTNTGHGTNTTGIIFGSGAGNAQGRGILPDGQGIFLAGLTTGPTRYAETAALVAAPYYGVFESNSTGSPQVTTYTSESANMDDIIFRLDVLICQSQSNTGNQNSRPQAWAKNMVSVGGINHFNTLTRADDSWGGASIGPASDGRLKPDLSHFYDNILCTSSSSDTSYTSSFGGTSGATPLTCGHFGLLFQMWADGVFDNTVMANTVFDAKPHTATARAIMFNTAEQYTFAGTGANLSRYKQGWGQTDMRNIWDFRNKMFIVNESDVLLPFATNTYRLYVAANEPRLKVTMVYKDLPGNPANQSQHRVNDLTLKVTSPSGTEYYGNNGLAAGNWSTSGGSSNTKDVVENVFVQSPETGVWIVQVSGDEIVADSHLQSVGTIDADYALVASGVVSILPHNITLERGLVVSGMPEDTDTSNNQRYVLRPGIVFSTSEAPLRVVAEANSPTNTLSMLNVTVESSATTASIEQRIELFNFNTNSYDSVLATAMTTGDNAVNASVPNPAAYVDANGVIRTRMSYRATAPVFSYPWNVSMDHVRIQIVP